MHNRAEFPQIGQLNMVAAGIIMSYSLLPFVNLPPRQVSFALPGIILSFNLNFTALVSLITAAIAAAGMDWMLRERTDDGPASTIPHLILPGLTAGAIGIPLGILEVGLNWWVLLGLGSILVLLVLVGEYISVNTSHQLFPIALMVLTAISFGLFLITAIAVRAANMRLFMTIGLIPLVYAFFGMRILQLRFGGSWPVKWTAVITIVIAQLTTALYYWPLSPIRFGLLILGPAYALVGIAAFLEEHTSFNDIPYEPLFVMGVIFLLAVIFG